MEPRESLGKRLGRFIALIGVIFAITLGVVVTQRLSQDSLALMVGLACGVMAMLPTVLLGLFVWRREVTRQASQQRAPMASPPIVVVAPQALTGYGMQRPMYGDDNATWQWSGTQPERTFTIVGGEE
jgi:Na+/proline symporter